MIMEFADIIIIVVAVISMIISAVAKSAKKKAEQQPGVPNADTQWQDEYDEEREPYDQPVFAREEVRQEQPEYASVTEERELWSYDARAIDSLNLRAQPAKGGGKFRERHPSEAAPNEDAHSTDRDVSKETPTEAFNLRDAIVYSELLKPKFKEY